MPIRIFHQSRVTNHEIYKLKNIYLQDFNSKIKSSEIKQQKIIQIDKVINYLRKILGSIIYIFIYLKRILCQKSIIIYMPLEKLLLEKKIN